MKNAGDCLYRVIILLLLLFLGGAVSVSAAEKRVLLLSSYHPGFPTFFDQVRGVQDALTGRDVLLDIEYMDSKRFHDWTSRTNFEDTLSHKIDHLPPYDLLLTADDNALQFVLNHRHWFFGAPLVFFGVNNIELARSLESDPNITGVVEQVSMAETVESMKRLLPELREVVAIVDGTASGQGDLKTFLTLAGRFPGFRFRHLSLADFSFAELGAELERLSRSSGVLLLSAYRDIKGKVKEFDDSLQFLLNHLHVPLFHLWEHGIGRGMIGGKVVSQYRQGVRAGSLACSILDGVPAHDIPLVTTSPNEFLFDFEVLTRFSIPERRLPENSTLLNKPEQRIVELGPVGTAVTISFLAVLVMLVLMLVLLMRRRSVVYEAIREREELFRALFQNNHAVMLLIDPESGKIVDSNPAAQSYYGYSAEEFRTRRVSDLNILPGQELTAVMDRVKAGKENYFQFQHRLATGAVRDVEVLSGPIEVQGKALLYSLVRDVTRRVEAEQRLKEAMHAAEASCRAKGEFLANMSHEVRTPMNGILGMLQLLGGTRLDAQQQELLSMALGSGKSLLHVINDILDLSRVEAGKMELNREPFSLKSMLDGIMSLFVKRVGEKGLRLSYDISPDLGPVYVGDEGRLRQVLLNLVGNAVKFTDRGEVSVLASSWPEGPGLKFDVRDTGIGIPEDRQQAIFEPFTQVDGSHTRAYEGSGLGLRIASRLAELMGGDIRVQSEPGKGSTFTFFMQTEAGSLDPVCAPSGPKPALKSVARELRVLVAEDNRVNQIAVKMMLERMGHRVEVVENGEKAVQALGSDSFDVVLMDIQMPVMDGVEALKRIRSGQDGVARPDIPVLALTAHAMKGERENFLKMGMDGYIAKPVVMEELQEELTTFARTV